jgi:hypothetical protein
VLEYTSLPDSTPQRHAATIPGFKLSHLVCINTLHKGDYDDDDNTNNNVAVIKLGQFVTRTGYTQPEVFSIICPGSFCPFACSFLLSWVTRYDQFCLHGISSFFCIPAFCKKNGVIFSYFAISTLVL